MGALFMLFFMLLLFGIPAIAGIASTAAVRRTQRLAQTGTPARGLVLQVSQTGTDVRFGMQRYERRSMVMDIEIFGRAPYELSCLPLIPKQIVGRVLPGTFLDVRVDPSNPSNIVVVGPGGVFFVE